MEEFIIPSQHTGPEVEGLMGKAMGGDPVLDLTAASLSRRRGAWLSVSLSKVISLQQHIKK